jgi:4-hydroxy-tetrahydrodipicolinate reductase
VEDIRIGLHGSTGRMGIVIKEVMRSRGMNSVYDFTPSIKGANIVDLCKFSDVVISFATPDSVDFLVQNAVKYNSKLVIGTTGITNFKSIESAAKQIAIFYSPNMSKGMAILQKIMNEISSNINEFDISIVEMHHKQKKDKPSGTALELGKSLANKDIEYHSIRAGNIFGEHSINLVADDERITIKHSAYNRKIFANGAIDAALWIYSQQPGKVYKSFLKN